MANILNIVILPTYDLNTLAIADASTYDGAITGNQIQITVPGFDAVIAAFTPNTVNIYNTTSVGLSVAGSEFALPDGIYCMKYMIDPVATSYVEKSIMRVEKLQQKFDEAFMQLDIMECDGAIKEQSKKQLTSIWFFIQGSVAAANNCSAVSAMDLYNQADKMLDNFLLTNCGCSESDYTITYQ